MRGRGCSFAASKVVARRRRLWLAVSITCSGKDRALTQHTRVRVFRWSGQSWRRQGSVSAELVPSQSIDAASLTGSPAPDFAIIGCGAGGISCLSVITHAGGRWHAVPFENGYGTSLVVNGAPVGRLVLIHAASYEPPTRTYERYVHGVGGRLPGRALRPGAVRRRLGPRGG